jgi:uncharacterized membrane protein
MAATTVVGMADEARGARPRRFERETLEFERVAFFSDAIFAIAMTLLVVSLDVPHLVDETSSKELGDAINDLSPQLLMFFISFAVLGSFWLAHHRTFGRLAGIDRRATTVNLVYLAFIAFLPFPSSLLGEYVNNAVAVTNYACSIAVISLSEAVMVEIAYRDGLFREMPDAVALRWQRILSLMPAVFFLATVPLAIVAPSAAVWSWILLFPVSILIQRRMPAEATAYFNTR